MYLARQIEIQPCFNRTVLNEMSETATNHLNELKQMIPEETDIDSLPNQTLKSLSIVPPKDNLLYNYEKLIVRLILSGKVEEMKQNLTKVLSILENTNDDDFYNRVFFRLCKECRYDVTDTDADSLSESSSNNSFKTHGKNLMKSKSSSLQNSISGIFINSSLGKSKIVNKINIQEILNIINIFLKEIQPKTINFNYTDNIKHQTCLHLTAINSQVELMKFCVSHHADIYRPDVFGRIPLHYVAMNGNIECTNFMIQAFNNQVSSPISNKSNKSEDIFDDIDQDGYSPTLYAIVRGHSECLKILLENYKNIDFTTSLTKLYHPLSLACEYGHKNVLLTLLEHGVKEEMNSDGLFPLHLACREGHPEIAKILINHGSDIDVLDKDNGWTPIFYCLTDGYIECVKVLLESGCKINIKDENGWYPLTYALYHGHIKIAQLLSFNKKTLESKGVMMDRDAMDISSSNTETSFNSSTEQPISKDKIINESIYSLSPNTISKINVYNPSEEEEEIYKQNKRIKLKNDNNNDDINNNNSNINNDSNNNNNLFDSNPQPMLTIEEKDSSDMNQDEDLSNSEPPSSNALNQSNLHNKEENPTDPYDINNPYHSIMEIPETTRMIPMAPSHLFSDIGNDENLDIDSLPPLSLPPPLVPFKLYGHNYLEKKIFLQIKLDNFTDPNQSPLTIYGTQNVCSLRLIVRTNPECGIPYDIILPQKPDDKPMNFFIDKDQDVNIEIIIDRAFSNQLIGKAVILSSRVNQIINYGRGDGSDPIEQCTVSLMDSHLHIIGKLSLRIYSISPFSHPALEIGGKVQTYWKSTATTKLVNKSNQEVGCLSIITASSISDDYINLPIQITKDGVPVVYYRWYITYHGIKFKIYDISYEQFKFFGEKLLEETSPKVKINNFKDNILKSFNYEDIENFANLELINSLYKSFLSLEEILKALSHRIGLNIELNYPTESVRNKLNIKLPFNINKTVDILLKTIYNHGGQRSIIFTSFNPFICTALKWKQPNYAVFFATCCGYKINHFHYHTTDHLYCDTTEQEELQTEKTCASLKEAINFAKENHFIGISCEATPLVQRPILINTIKESGLFLTTFGKENLNPDSVKLQEKLGVDAIVVNEVVRIFK